MMALWWHQHEHDSPLRQKVVKLSGFVLFCFFDIWYSILSSKIDSSDLIQKFHLLWSFRWRLPSFSTLDEWLAMTTGNTATRCNCRVASLFFFLGDFKPGITRNSSQMWDDWYCPSSLFMARGSWSCFTTSRSQSCKCYLYERVRWYYHFDDNNKLNICWPCIQGIISIGACMVGATMYLKESI